MEPRPPIRRGPSWLLALLLYTTGCGSMHFSYHSIRATEHVEQARQMGGEELAPYEFTLATLYLEKAHEEVGRAEYQDAVVFARVAHEQAIAAVRVCRKARAEQAAAASAGAESEP